MLFQSQVPQLLDRLGFLYSTQANNLRKESAAKALDLYNGQQLTHLEARLNELFSEPDQITKVCINVIRKIIHQQAQTFREPPILTVNPDSDQDIFNEIAEGCSLEIVLKQCSRLLKLTKSMLVKVVYKDDQIRLDLISGNLIENVLTGDSPYDLKKVLLIDYGQSERIEDVQYTYWDCEVFRRLDFRFRVIEEQQNPYSALPFVPLFDTYNCSSSFFLPLDESLFSCQMAINEKLADLLYVIRQQGFGVGWIRSGGGATGTIRITPGSLVQLQGDNSALGFESQKSPVEAIFSGLQKLITWTAVSQGLSAGSLSTDPHEQSGVSKAWDSKELGEMRIDDLQIWRGYLRDIFNTIKIVWNTHASRKMSNKAYLKVRFAEPQQKLTVTEQAKADDLRIAQGVMSPVDVILRDNPDIESRPNALALLLQLREEIKTLTE